MHIKCNNIKNNVFLHKNQANNLSSSCNTMKHIQNIAKNTILLCILSSILKIAILQLDELYMHIKINELFKYSFWLCVNNCRMCQCI